MSYRCQLCNSLIGPKVRQSKVVTAKREREYRNEEGKVSQGWEIVRELKVCPDCIGKR